MSNYAGSSTLLLFSELGVAILLNNSGAIIRLKLALASLLISLSIATVTASQQVADGEALIKAMHALYEKSWYETVTFTQKSTTYHPDGTTKVETWYEAASLPGKLRIDIGPVSDGNGVILSDGNATFFQKGVETANRPLVNLLLVLGFDVYRQPPEATIARLKAEAIDLTKIHEEFWQGEPVYVVGADKGDLKSKQFWVEKKRLLFLRIIEPNRYNPTKLDDVRFTDYRQLHEGIIAARVEVYNEEKLVFSEDYSDIQIGVKLDPAVLDPKHFTTAHWQK
jgi:outer membrane lipoprotein-sorting protein